MSTTEATSVAKNSIYITPVKTGVIFLSSNYTVTGLLLSIIRVCLE